VVKNEKHTFESGGKHLGKNRKKKKKKLGLYKGMEK